MKQSYIHMRVETLEKERIQKLAKQQGFDGVTQYVLWLIRQQSGARLVDKAMIDPAQATA